MVRPVWYCCEAMQSRHNISRARTLARVPNRGDRNLQERPDTSKKSQRPARKPYATPTLVKRQKLGRIAASDSVISGTDNADN